MATDQILAFMLVAETGLLVFLGVKYASLKDKNETIRHQLLVQKNQVRFFKLRLTKLRRELQRTRNSLLKLEFGDSNDSESDNNGPASDGARPS